MAAGQSSLYARVLTLLGVGQARKTVLAVADTDTVAPLTQTLDGRLRTDAYIEQLCELTRLLTDNLLSADAKRDAIIELLGLRGSQPAPNSLPVIVSSSQTPIPTSSPVTSVAGQITATNANISTGRPTEKSYVQIALNGESTVAIELRGTFSVSITPQVSMDGENWTTANVAVVNSSSQVSSLNTAGISKAEVAGMAFFRLSCSNYTSGACRVILRACTADALYMLWGYLTSGSAIVNLTGTGNQSLSASTTAALATTATNFAALAAATNVKATAGNVFGWSVNNTTAAVIFLQFFNTAGTPTAGTSVLWSIPLPIGVTTFVSALPIGAGFSTGIGVALTTTIGGAVVAAATDLIMFYK